MTPNLKIAALETGAKTERQLMAELVRKATVRMPECIGSAVHFLAERARVRIVLVISGTPGPQFGERVDYVRELVKQNVPLDVDVEAECIGNGTLVSTLDGVIIGHVTGMNARAYGAGEHTHHDVELVINTGLVGGENLVRTTHDQVRRADRLNMRDRRPFPDVEPGDAVSVDANRDAWANGQKVGRLMGSVVHVDGGHGFERAEDVHRECNRQLEDTHAKLVRVADEKRALARKSEADDAALRAAGDAYRALALEKRELECKLANLEQSTVGVLADRLGEKDAELRDAHRIIGEQEREIRNLKRKATR